MAREELWIEQQEIDKIKSKKTFNLFHLSILFVATIILAAIIMRPILAEKTNINMAYQGINNYDNLAIGYDNITTGSIDKTLSKIQKQPSFKKKYTIRHSVTQFSEKACIILDGQTISSSCQGDF